MFHRQLAGCGSPIHHAGKPGLVNIEVEDAAGLEVDTVSLHIHERVSTQAISHVVLDTATWEASTAFHLETSPFVVAYARTDHMGFAIPYTFAGAGHNFFPDFLARLANGATLVLEVKGYEDEQDRAKYAAAGRWCEAVSNWGQMGRWVFDHCGGPGSVRGVLARHGQ